MKDSIIVTDEWKGYRGLNADFDHIIMNHQRKEYSNNGFSSNNVENFWSHLKRGIYGMYHKVNRNHLHRYKAEFTYRFNTREKNEIERLEHVIEKTESIRLNYKNFIRKAA